MELQDIVGLILVYLVIACSLAAMLYCKKRGINADYRKILHAGVGFFVFFWWMFSANWIMLVFFTVPFGILVFLAMFQGNPVSDSDLGEVSNDGHRIGLFVYVVSINILVIFFFDAHWTAASVGIVAMTFGDSAGSVIGKRYGRHRIVNGKSLEGTLGVFAVTAIMSFVIMTLYAYLGSIGAYAGAVDPIVPIWAASLIAGVVTCISELFCPGAYDNLSNSMTAAIAMCLLGL